MLLRFRKHEIAVVCDISEMYLRVGIHETDRRFHRLLWDEREYELKIFVFGVNASPFLAQLVAQKMQNSIEVIIQWQLKLFCIAHTWMTPCTQ